MCNHLLVLFWLGFFFVCVLFSVVVVVVVVVVTGLFVILQF